MREIGPNNGRGRPPGATNLVNREFKDAWHLFLTSQEYRDSAKKRILDGNAPHLETYLLNRIYGKPKEHVEITVGVQEDDYASMSTDELRRRSAELLEQLAEAKELEAAIPAEYRLSPSSQPEETLERPPSNPLRENEPT